jgi:hypothetical protein
MHIPGWLKHVIAVAPTALSAFPATAAIAPLVGVVIDAAGKMGDDTTTGPQRKQSALEMFAAIVAIINSKAGKIVIDPATALAAANTGIETVISVAKAVDASHPPAVPTTSGATSPIRP